MPVSIHHTTGKSSKVQAALWDTTLMPLKSVECSFKLTFIKCEWHITDTHNKTGRTSNGMRVGVKLLQLWSGAIQSCLQFLQFRGSCSYSEKTLEKAKTPNHRYNVDTVKVEQYLYCGSITENVCRSVLNGLEKITADQRYNIWGVWLICCLYTVVVPPYLLFHSSLQQHHDTGLYR